MIFEGMADVSAGKIIEPFLLINIIEQIYGKIAKPSFIKWIVESIANEFCGCFSID